jgi:hypothetical protein
LSVKLVELPPEFRGWPLLGSTTVALPAFVAASAGKTHDNPVSDSITADTTAPMLAAKRRPRRVAGLWTLIGPP